MSSRRLLFLLPLLVAVPLLGFEAVTHLDLRAEREAEVQQQAARLLSVIKDEQRRIIQNARDVLGTLVEAGVVGMEATACQDTMERLRGRYPAYLAASITDRHGTIRCSTVPGAAGVSIARRDTVRAALATDRVVTGQHITTIVTKQPALPFALSYRGPDGSPAGVVSVLIDIGWINEYLATKPLPENASVLLADGKGTVLAHTPDRPDAIGRPLPERYRPLLNRTQDGTVEMDGLNGTVRVHAYSPPLGEPRDLFIAVGISKDDAMRPLNAAAIRSMTIFTILLVLSCTAAALGLRRYLRVREQAHETATRMAAVLSSTTDAVMEVDHAWRITFINERARAITDHNRLPDPIGTDFWQAFPTMVGTDAWRRGREAMERQAPDEFDVRSPLSGRWYAVRLFPSQRGLAAYFQDITERKRMEDAVRQAKEDAEKAAASKSKFLAAASHDLRQPMQALLLFAGALEGHVHDERGQKSLRHLERGLDALKELLDSLLDVSRLDAGVIQPVIREFPIAEVLDEIDASYAAVCRGMGLDWQVAQCGATIRSDPTLLRRLIRNLVENAVRFTKEGFIRIECHCDDGRLCIAVRDSGPGIPSDQLERIFEEFHQVGNSERDRQQGLGLGLAIVRRIADLLGYRVTVESTPGKGAVFAFDAPRAEAQPVVTPDIPRVAPGCCDRFALVIDDDAMVLIALETMLRTWGYEVIVAGSADEALDHLRGVDRSPDLVVADYRLRDGKVGTEAVLRVRERFGRSVPGILLTGELGPECQRDAAAHGLHVIYKPVTPRQLSQALDERTKAEC